MILVVLRVVFNVELAVELAAYDELAEMLLEEFDDTFATTCAFDS